MHVLIVPNLKLLTFRRFAIASELWMAKAERNELDEDVQLKERRGLGEVEEPACERPWKQQSWAELESHGDEKMQRAKGKPAREFGVNADLEKGLTPWKFRR